MPDFFTASPVGAAVQGGLGVAQSVIGLINAGKLKREAEQLKESRPDYKLNPLVNDELSFAESSLANGMSAAAKTGYEQGIDRDLSTSLDAILKGGGSPNNVADIYDRSQVGRQKLAMLQEQIRQQQINNLVSAQRYKTGEQDKQWQINEFAPWADEAQANANQRVANNQMIWSGLGAAGAAGVNYAGEANRANQLNNYFRTDQPQSQPYAVDYSIERITPNLGSTTDQVNVPFSATLNNSVPNTSFNNFVGPINR